MQSLASLPEEQGQADNTIAHSSQVAVLQLHDWLSQLQQHANDASREAVSRCLSVCIVGLIAAALCLTL